MNMLPTSTPRTRQAGFTLVEMMVAVTIGLLVLLGMTASFVNLKIAFRSQDKLAQLQDNERLAMSVLTTAVNEAGYYPDPKSASSIVASSPSAAPGAAMPTALGIEGTALSANFSESLSVAYVAAAGSDLPTCLGTNNAAGLAKASVRNTFYVDTTTNTLMCKVMVNGSETGDPMTNGGGAQPLISGVQKMSMQYGIAPIGTSQVNQYKTIANMATPDWPLVSSVRLSLVFVNPFDSTQTITRTHTINLMN